MRFLLIDAKKAELLISRMRMMLGVSPSGFRTWKDRPACYRQRQDMVLLAQVRSVFKLSKGTYGSPRMVVALRNLISSASCPVAPAAHPGKSNQPNELRTG